MADRSVIVRLRAEVNSYVAGMKQAKDATTEFGREITGRGKAARADIEAVGRGALVMAGGLAIGLGASAKAAVDWETAWAGVSKTVDGTASQMADLEGGLRDLAKELPATHGEIAAVAEAAGQLGIQRGAIEGFTKTMIDLGETTNLTADQAATSMARMANIMGTPQADIERMASTLVALGNAGASTESEILDMAMRIAGSAKQVGISEAATLGFANALSSVGIEAEAGGTAISRVFSTIASAVADGGEAVSAFAEIAGMSSQQFSTAFEEDAAGATIAFIEGLDGIKAAGGNVFAVLQDLELGDIRVRDALLRAAGAGDLFRESLALGADEWERNNALQTEAEKRYDTTAAKLEVARNNIVDLGIDIGGVLLPALAGAAEGATDLVRGFSEMPGPLKTASVGVAGLSTAFLGTVGLIGTFGPKVKEAQDALMKMGGAGQFVGRNMGRMAAGLGIAGVAMAGISYVLGENSRRAAEAEDRVKGYAEAIRAAGDATQGTRDQVVTLLEDTPLLASTLEEAGFTAADLGSALSGSDEDFETFARQVAGAGEAAGLTKDQMIQLGGALLQNRDAAVQGAENAETLGEVIGDTGDEAAGASPKLGGLAGDIEANAEAAKAATEAIEAYQDQLRAGIDPVFAMANAIADNEEAQRKYAEALKANSDAIDDNNVSQAELDQMLQDAAESALDMEIAASDLEEAMLNGNVSAEQFREQLNRWVYQGTLTAEQADILAWKFGITADQADRIDGDRTARLHVSGQGEVQDVLGRVEAQLARITMSRTIRINLQLENPYVTVPGLQVYAGGVKGATGGHVSAAGIDPLYRAAGGPSGTDTVPAWLSPGEWVMQKSAVDRFGVGFMRAINEGIMPGGGGTTVVNRYDVSVNAGSIVGDHRELVRVVQRGMAEAARLTAA